MESPKEVFWVPYYYYYYYYYYINDLPSVVQSYIKIFADDTKLFSAIKDEYDSEVLQNDLYLLDEWSRTWKIYFMSPNVKCSI